MKPTTRIVASLLLLLLTLFLGTSAAATSQDEQDLPEELGQVLDLDYSNISLAYKGDWVLVIYAEWCPHCHSLMGILPEVAKEVEGKASVARVEASNAFWAQLQFFVEGFPTVYHLHNGQARLYEGDRDADEIAEFVLEKWAEVPAIPYWKSPTALHIRMLAGYAEGVRAIYSKIEIVADRLDVDPFVLTVIFAVLSCLFLIVVLTYSAKKQRKNALKQRKEMEEKKKTGTKRTNEKGGAKKNEDKKKEVKQKKQPSSKNKKKID